ASDLHLNTTGMRPRVFLVTIGTPAEYNARAGFARNFFGAGGFEVVAGDGYTTVSDAADAFAESGASIAVICSTDQKYAEIVETLAPQLHRSDARCVILAGHPGEREEKYREAGVDRFIFMKCDVLGTLTELLTEEGVLA
ncbi:MAG: methylmalonyl-CoA mutase, partial [Planctomycetota bacterium]